VNREPEREPSEGGNMLTIFTIPKAFKGHIGVIQRNAIVSWTKLAPQPEIILLGSDEGTAELAQELGLRHIANIATSDRGTPLLNDMFDKAEQAASFARMCYVNADIILTRDFLRAVDLIERQMPRSLMVSKRINLDIREPLEFGAAWEEEIRTRSRVSGADEHYSGIDIFVFPKGMYPEIPPFAIGRLWFDHWLIKAVREQQLPVIDASNIAPLLHQNHDYNHIAGGAAEVWKGEEMRRNFALYGGVEHAYTLLDVTHELMPDGSIQAVRFRKPLFKAKAWAWEWFVRRTARARHALGLYRKTAAAENKQAT
jgi:hypothetical protein